MGLIKIFNKTVYLFLLMIKEDELQFIKKILEVSLQAEDKLKEAYEGQNPERVNLAKKFLMEVNRKISEITG